MVKSIVFGVERLVLCSVEVDKMRRNEGGVDNIYPKKIILTSRLDAYDQHIVDI